MPYNLAAAAPTKVMPQSLSTSFVVTRVYPLLSAMYNDGTYERSLIVDTQNAPRVMRTWVLAKRLTLAKFLALKTFWETTVQAGEQSFYFYDPTDVLAGQEHGSNYDPLGGNMQGRAVVFFRGNWAETIEPGRNTVPSLTLVEIA